VALRHFPEQDQNGGEREPDGGGNGVAEPEPQRTRADAKEEPPDAKHREIDFRKLVIALLIEGAIFRLVTIFRLVKGLTDHGARQGYARLTGSWPGDEAPEPE